MRDQQQLSQPHFPASMATIVSSSSSSSSSSLPSSDQSASESTTTWNELRREARKLEGDLDVRLSSYAKLSDFVELRGTGDVQWKTLEMGIEVLTEVNEDMSRWASATIVGLTSNVMKRLTRHQEILHELMQEFKRTRKNLLTVREHAELLNSVRNDINEYKGSSGVQLEPNLLRERAAIHGSVTHIDEVTGKAEILRGVLTDQRSAFGEIQGKMKHISDKFPVIRVTIGAIKRKKSRDTIILLAVSAVCSLFLVIYSISK